MSEDTKGKSLSREERPLRADHGQRHKSSRKFPGFDEVLNEAFSTYDTLPDIKDWQDQFEDFLYKLGVDSMILRIKQKNAEDTSGRGFVYEFPPSVAVLLKDFMQNSKRPYKGRRPCDNKKYQLYHNIALGRFSVTYCDDYRIILNQVIDGVKELHTAYGIPPRKTEKVVDQTVINFWTSIEQGTQEYRREYISPLVEYLLGLQAVFPFRKLKMVSQYAFENVLSREILILLDYAISQDFYTCFHMALTTKVQEKDIVFNRLCVFRKKWARVVKKVFVIHQHDRDYALGLPDNVLKSDYYSLAEKLVLYSGTACSRSDKRSHFRENAPKIRKDRDTYRKMYKALLRDVELIPEDPIKMQGKKRLHPSTWLFLDMASKEQKKLVRARKRRNIRRFR